MRAKASEGCAFVSVLLRCVHWRPVLKVLKLSAQGLPQSWITLDPVPRRTAISEAPTMWSASGGFNMDGAYAALLTPTYLRQIKRRDIVMVR